MKNGRPRQLTKGEGMDKICPIMSGGGKFYYEITSSEDIKNSNGNFYICQKEKCQLWVEVYANKGETNFIGETTEIDVSHCGLIK